MCLQAWGSALWHGVCPDSHGRLHVKSLSFFFFFKDYISFYFRKQTDFGTEGLSRVDGVGFPFGGKGRGLSLLMEPPDSLFNPGVNIREVLACAASPSPWGLRLQGRWGRGALPERGCWVPRGGVSVWTRIKGFAHLTSDPRGALISCRVRQEWPSRFQKFSCVYVGF